MTIGWRLCRAPFADLSGEGAQRYGGRWNSPGAPVVYASESAALCLLEVRVHLDVPLDLVPDDYVLLSIEFGGLEIETLDRFPESARTFGDEWLAQGRSPILRVPSFLIPESTNLLVNPRHPQAVDIVVIGQRPFTFDSRLWNR